jgi:hypothetical protein
MKDHLPQIISIEGVIALVFGIFLAVADINWIVRIVLVLVCIGLIGLLAWRLQGPKWARIIGTFIASAILASLSWGPIRADYIKTRAIEIRTQIHKIQTELYAWWGTDGHI